MCSIWIKQNRKLAIYWKMVLFYMFWRFLCIYWCCSKYKILDWIDSIWCSLLRLFDFSIKRKILLFAPAPHKLTYTQIEIRSKYTIGILFLVYPTHSSIRIIPSLTRKGCIICISDKLSVVLNNGFAAKEMRKKKETSI